MPLLLKMTFIRSEIRGIGFKRNKKSVIITNEIIVNVEN